MNLFFKNKNKKYRAQNIDIILKAHFIKEEK